MMYLIALFFLGLGILLAKGGTQGPVMKGLGWLAYAAAALALVLAVFA